MDSLFSLIYLSLIVFAFASYLAFPYLLHFDSLKFDKPIVRFSPRIWRGGLHILTFNVLAFVILCVAVKVPLEETHWPIWQRMMALCLISLFALPYALIVNWLHVTYWRHDRDASLIVNQVEQRVSYYNYNQQLDFDIADVARIIDYSPRNGRAPWGTHEYHLFVLKDGTEIIITFLLYSILDAHQLFPAAQRGTIKRSICWLPTQHS